MSFGTATSDDDLRALLAHIPRRQIVTTGDVAEALRVRRVAATEEEVERVLSRAAERGIVTRQAGWAP